MYIVEIFDGTDWNLASTHTQLVDAQYQIQIFKDRGIEEANIRIIVPSI